MFQLKRRNDPRETLHFWSIGGAHEEVRKRVWGDAIPLGGHKVVGKLRDLHDQLLSNTRLLRQLRSHSWRCADAQTPIVKPPELIQHVAWVRGWHIQLIGVHETEQLPGVL